MRINVVGRQMAVPKDFYELAERKLSKYDKFFRDDATAHITLRKRKNLEILELSKKITSLAEGAFAGCAIKELVIPASVTRIDGSAFYQTPLESVTFEDATGWYYFTQEDETHVELFKNDVEDTDIMASYLRNGAEKYFVKN
jgi:hypothetical protein